jgi:hypothetical protein
VGASPVVLIGEGKKERVLSEHLAETIASCECGSVQLQIAGTPITRVICYCDDCQAGSSQLARLPHAPNPLGPDGGTDYVLFRKDRLRFLKGEQHIRPHKVSQASKTNRLLASCCNTFMYMSFDDSRHWRPVWTKRFQTAPIPLSMRICARYAPKPSAIPGDVPVHKSYPLSFMAKLVAAWIPLLLGR